MRNLVSFALACLILLPATGVRAEVFPGGDGDDPGGVDRESVAVKPTAVITHAQTSSNSATPNRNYDLTFAWSQGVDGFDADDITVTNATKCQTLSGGNQTFVCTILIDPDWVGSVTVTVRAGAATATDGSGDTSDPMTHSFQVDNKVPELLTDGATVSRDSIVLQYDELLSEESQLGHVPVPSAYVVTIMRSEDNSGANTTVTPRRVDVSGERVYVLLPQEDSVWAGETVTLDYTTGTLRDLAGNHAEAFTAMEVMNLRALGVPGAVQNLTAMELNTDSIKIDWDPPADDGGSAITGYRIQASNDGGATWTVLRSSSTGSEEDLATEYLHDDLEPDETWHYLVSAINAVGESTITGTSATTKREGTAPGRPALTATPVGATAIRLNWTPADTGTSAITSYRIEVSADSGSTYQTHDSVGGTTTTYLHSGLQSNTTRHYRVYAKNTTGESPPSNPAHATTTVVTTAPDPPTGLSATAQGTDRIDLSWTAPASDGNSAITGYRIEASDDAEASWTDLMANTGNTSTTYPHTGLDPGTTWHYRVSAINAVGTSVPSDTASATTEGAVPGRPTGLRATAQVRNQIDLAWSAPTDDGGLPITGYLIQYSTNGSSWSRLDSIGPDRTAHSDDRLGDGVTRHYQVAATNVLGAGPWSRADSATTLDVPDRPRNLDATPDGQTRIKLEWDPPNSNGGSPITGYRIEFSEDDQASWDLVVDSLDAETTVHEGLTAGTRYYYRVFAWNVIGRSARSNIDFANTAARVPDAPTNLTATAIGRTRIDLDWDPPANNGGSDITGYRIEISADGGATWPESHDEGTLTQWADRGLSAGTTRHYRVRAINSEGPGAASNEDSATTAPNVPGPPQGLTAVGTGMTSIRLTWSPPASDSGSAISGYRIEVSNTGTSGWSVLAANTTLTDTEYNHTGLTPDTTLYYRVQAINGVGAGAVSNVARATTDPRVPDAPGNLTATAGGPLQINLAWTPPAYDGGSPVTGYQIEVSADGGTSWTFLVFNTNSAATSYVHSGLLPGSTRHYRVSAINGVGAGAASNIDNATTEATVPASPTNLDAMANGASRIDLSWTAPNYDGGSPVTGYRIDVSANRGVTWTTLEANTGSTATAYSHMNLPAATRRDYRVSALNAVGQGLPSNEAYATTGAGLPDAPTGLTARARGTSQIELDWVAPSYTGGAAITGYRIEVSENGSSGWEELADVPATPTSYTDDGLDPATTRHYRVSAINVAGTGDASRVASATTNATTPDAPTALAATADGTSRINLAWTAPGYDGGASVIGYRIEVSVDGGANWRNLVLNTQSTSTTYTHIGLRPATTRHYRVSAMNVAGVGEPSNEAHATTAAATPASPTDLEAMANGPFQIDIAWTAPNYDGGSPVTGYRIEVSTTRGATWTTLQENTGSTSTAYSHVSLPAATRRDYRVSAHNAVGSSFPSNEAFATTDADLPDAPTELMAMARGSARIVLSWNAPDYTGGVQITGYRIEVSENGSVWTVLEDDTESRDTDYIHTGLDPATTRHYRVSAINVAGAGDRSNEASATTEAIAPDAPTDLSATADGTSRIDLAWIAPDYDGGARVMSYRIEVSINGGATWTELVSNTQSTSTIYAHTGLDPATTRHYRVSAINRIGAGEPSEVAHATTDATVPDAPQRLTADAHDHSRIDLGWTAPNFNGGSSVTGYRIEVSENEGSTWTDLVANTRSTDTEYSHTGLNPASTRHYRVSAINAIGTGSPSNVANATTDAIVPDAPTNLMAIATAPTRIDLSWTAPAYDGGAPVTSYRIEVSENGATWTDLQASTGSNRTNYAHVGLRPGSTRHYRVSAINVAGTGLPSGVATASTDDPVERAGRVNEAVLPHFAAAMNTSTMSAIAGRIETVASRNPLESQLRAAGLLQRAATMDLNGSGLNMGRVFDGASFAMPLNSGMQVQNGGTPAGFTTWGSAEYTSMGEPSGDQVEWDGSMFSVHLGADMRVHRDILAGIAGTRSSGNYDFTDGTGAREVEGTYEARMTSLNPYLAWLPGRTGVSLWAAGSFGWGEVQVEDDPGGMRASDASLRTGAVGGGRILVSSGSSTLRLRGEGWLSQVEVEGGEGMDSLTLDMHRIRVAVEWSQAHSLQGGHEVNFMLEGGLRYGDGDGTEGSGMEVGGGLRYTSATKALTMEGHGRLLVTSPNDYEEWGFRGLIQVDPQAVNRGLSLKVVPAWGQSASGVQELWDRGVSNRGDFSHDLGKGRVNTRVEYGLGDFSGTPYGRFYLANGGARAFGTGMKYEITRVLDMRFEGTRTESASGPARHGLAMRGRWVF